MDPLTVGAAMASAMASGVEARLMVGLQVVGEQVLLGVTTSDGAPELEIVRRAASRRVELLQQRHASGPDRWDYPLPLGQYREVYRLRLERCGEIRDLPLLPAAGALTREHGWNDSAFDKVAEPLVEFLAFRRAITDLAALED